MLKTRLGGIKVFEKRACLFHLCRNGAEALGEICSRLAADRVNFGLLTYIADFEGRVSLTAGSMKSIDAVSGYAFGKIGPGEFNVDKTLADAYRISIFPHDQKPGVTASLIGALADNGMKPNAVGSSPSAMTVIVSSADFRSAMERIFETFTFHAFDSFQSWQAAYGDQEETLLKNVRSPFHEDIITIYDFNYRTDMDLWGVKLPVTELGNFSANLSTLNQFKIRMPFFISISLPDDDHIYFSSLFETVHHDIVKQTLPGNLSELDLYCVGPATVFLLHGPHFGDRYGIANTLVKALQRTGIPVLALSCAISSISLVVRAGDSDQTIHALGSVFQTSTGQLKN